MTIVLFVEGETEKYLPTFFKQWLDERLEERVQIKAVNFKGVANYRKDIVRRANLALSQGHVRGGLGVIDLYGSGLPYPDGTIDQKYQAMRQQIESDVGHPRFRQHFSVHETEAWLFSQPQVFPEAIRDAIPNSPPETVNFNNPPSRRLAELYRTRLKQKYAKPIEGAKLFRTLDPSLACERCPHLAMLLQDLYRLATVTVE